MPRNITLTFDDGSSHVYQNAPDDITPDAVMERAGREFTGKAITHIDGGRSPSNGNDAARAPLNRWVSPSNAGGGRGFVNPPTDPKEYIDPNATSGRFKPPSFIERAADSVMTAMEPFGKAMAPLNEARPKELLQAAGELARPTPQPSFEEQVAQASKAQGPTSPAPVDQKAFAEIKSTLGAMPREQRMLATNLPGWKGQAARAAIEQLDQEQQGIDSLKLGGMSPTIEGRTAHFASQGASPEVARSMATGEMVSGGVSEPVRFLKDGGQTAEADAAARQEGRDMQGRSLGVRAGFAALEGMKAGTQGVAAAALRAAGDDETANAMELSARRSKIKVDSANELTAMRAHAQELGTVYGNDAFWENQTVGGLASAAQNAPQIAAGMALTAVTKNPVAGARLSMGLMTSQSFGDQYIDGRMKQMTPGQAAARAGIMAGFEYLGERWGLVPQAMKAVRGKAGEVPLEELPHFLERFVGALEKRGVLGGTAANVARGQLGEQFGEQLTTAGQYLVDGTPLGLDQPISLSGYLEAARDTAIQTVIATGALEGAGGGIHKLAGGHSEVSPNAGAYEASRAQAKAEDKWRNAFGADGAGSPLVVPSQGAAPAAAPQADAQPQAPGAVPTLEQGSLVRDAGGTPSTVDVAAHQAATSPNNDLPEPTQAQKEAGNYKVGRTRIGGMDIRIENPEGSVRKGVDANGTPWETQMRHHYGYFAGTMAADGDKLDVFVKPGLSEDWSGPVFVIDQVDPATGKLDEHKVVMGAQDEAEAEQIYRSNYADDWQGLGAITKLPLPAFKAWAKSGKLKQPLGDISGHTVAQDAPAAPPEIAGKPVTELQTGQLLRYANMDGISERVRQVAAAEVKRRETEAMWAQREQQRQSQEAAIVSEAKDQQVAQAVAASNAAEVDAPTAMAEAFARAMKKKGATSEQIAPPAPAEPTPAQTSQAPVDPGSAEAPAAGTPTTGVSTAGGLAAVQAAGVKRPKTRQHPPTVRGSGALAKVSRALGGLSPDLLPDLSEKMVRERTSKSGKKTKYTSWDNPAIPGVGPLFRNGGTADLSEVARVLEESGYLEPGSVERDPVGATQRAQEIIRGELRQGGSAVQVGNAEAIDAEMRARQAAEMDSVSDPWEDFTFTPDDLDEVGFTDADPQTKALTEQLLAEAESLGVDTESIREDVARQLGEEASQNEYHAATQEALRQAVGQVGQDAEGGDTSPARTGDQDGSSPAVQESGAGEQQPDGGSDQEGLTLQAQTEEDLRQKADREAQGAIAEEARKAAERELIRQDDQARDNKARADATVDDFQLGQTADQQLSGMSDLFSSAQDNGKQTSPDRPAPVEKALITDVGEKIGGARKDTAGKTGARPSRATPTDPGWRRRYVAVQSMTDMTKENRPWHLLDKKAGKSVRIGYEIASFPTQEEAEQAIPLVEVARNHRVTTSNDKGPDGSHRFVIMRDVSDRKRVQVVAQDFASREEAMQYMHDHPVQIIETRTSFGEEILPKPDNAMRTGEARRAGDAKGEDFIRDFGLRGVEFGNWNNQDERQEVMNHAYDALADLADIINVPPKALSLNGQLGLAFGARGQGLSGARAHYEIPYGVINLTKMSGAGSLGHEWFHSMDHYFARQDGKTARERTENKRGDLVFDVPQGAEASLASSGFLLRGSGVRQEVRDAYEALIKTMFLKAETYVEDTKATERFVGATKTDLANQLQSIRRYLERELDPKYYKRHNKPATADHLAAFDAIAEKLIAGEGLATSLKHPEDGKSRRGVLGGARWTNDALEQISAIVKSTRGVTGFRADRSGMLDTLRGYLSRYEQRLKLLSDAQAGSEKQRTVPTSFAMEAKSIDQGRASDYWSTPHEMAARAFEAYVTDKVAERGNQSDFLAYGTNSAVLTPWGWKRPYPTGDERVAINKAFDKFLQVLKTKTDESGNVALFSAGDASTNAAIIDKAELDQVIQRNLSGWRGIGTTQITAVETWRDLPDDVLQSAENMGLNLSKLEGVLHRGRVTLVRGAIKSAEQAERILFHEIYGHIGLKAALDGRSQETLDALWHKLNGLAGVAKLAKKHEAAPGVSVWQRLQPYIKGTEYANQTDRRAVIMDELVAYLAQANDTTALTTFKGYLADMKASVVRTLKRFGLDGLADRLDRAGTEFDVLALVRDARNSIVTGKTRAGNPFVLAVRGQVLSPAFSEVENSRFSMRDDRPVDLTDAIIGHQLGAATGHPDYAAAKAGDVAASFRLAQDLVTPDVVNQVRDAVGSDVLVQPVVAEEASGRNKIPRAVAEVLASRLGATTGSDIMQSTRAYRTGMDGLGRLFASPEFAGQVESGGRYLLVDDTLTQGGTFAALASHITQNGGKVAGVFALTGKQYSAKLALSPDLLSKVRETYSDVEPAFRAATGRGFDSLTESEARYLAKHKSPQSVRDRISEAGRQAGQRADQGNDQGQQESLSGDAPSFSTAGGFDLPEFGRTGKFIEAIQNRYNRWKQAIDAVRKQGGTVNEANDFYQAEERYWGIVGAQLDDFKDEVSQFVKDVKADGLELDDVALYAYAKHAPERNAAIAKINPAMPEGGSGMTDDQARAIIDSAKQAGLDAKLERHAAELNRWSEGTRQVLLQNGLISKDEYDQWTGAYQHYVPLRGQLGDDGSRMGTGSGFDIRGKESFRAMGRRSQAGHIIEHILQDRARALTRAGKNEVLRRFARFVLDNPDKSLWEVDATVKRRGIVQTPTGEQVTETEGVNKDVANTVALKDGGQTIYITVKDDTLLKQLKNLHDEAKLPVVVESLHWANRLLSRMYTSLNPVFTVLNGMRDASSGAMNMVGVAGFKGAGAMLGNLPGAYREAFRAEVKGTPSASYEEYRRSGGKTGFMDFKDIEGYAKELSDMAQESQSWAEAMNAPGAAAKAKASWRKARGAVRKVLDRVEDINGAVENATRFATFKAARDAGKSVAESANIAKNITINFNRRGSMTPVLSSWFLFFNPAVQGSARMVEALRSRQVQGAMGAAMVGMFGLALANAAAGGDDDDDGMTYWDKIPDEVKERNLVIMLPPGSDTGEKVPGSEYGRYLKIPMPYGYNSFAVLAQTLADILRNQGNPVHGVSAAKGATRIFKSIVGSWIPVSDVAPSFDNPKAVAMIGVPDALDPIVESVLNINSFGKQLYPEDSTQDKLPDSEKVFGAQRHTWKHNAARWLNEATGGSQYHEGMISITPATIDNLVRGYGGGVASFISALADTTVSQGIDRDEFEWWRGPFIKQLYGRVDGMQDQALAYDHLHAIQQAAEPYKRAVKAGDREAADAIEQQFGSVAKMGRVADRATQRLTVIRKHEARVIDSTTLTSAEKNVSLKQWDRERQKVYDQVNREWTHSIEMDAAQ